MLEHGEIVEKGKVEELLAILNILTTKRFLHTLLHDDVPEHLFDFKNPEQELLRLYFKGGGTKEACDFPPCEEI